MGLQIHREPLLQEPSAWEAESIDCEGLAHSPVNTCDGHSGDAQRGVRGPTLSGMFHPPSAPPIGQTDCHLGALAGTKRGCNLKRVSGRAEVQAKGLELKLLQVLVQVLVLWLVAVVAAVAVAVIHHYNPS